MTMLTMLEDYEGCKKGDQVRFEDPREAVALIKLGKAEPYVPPGTETPEGEDAEGTTHSPPVASAAERLLEQSNPAETEPVGGEEAEPT